MNKLVLTFAAMILSTSLAYATDADTSTEAPPAPTRTREQIREEIKAQIEQVKAACQADIEKADCKGKEGRKAIRCVQRKVRHSNFQLSEGCQNAIEKGREARKQFKMAHKERKGKKHKKETN